MYALLVGEEDNPLQGGSARVHNAMAHLVSSFGGLARRAVNRTAVLAFSRSANSLAVADDNSFLRFTTPEPQQYVHGGILAANETKVRLC